MMWVALVLAALSLLVSLFTLAWMLMRTNQLLELVSNPVHPHHFRPLESRSQLDEPF
jgi:hypothetical protein